MEEWKQVANLNWATEAGENEFAPVLVGTSACAELHALRRRLATPPTRRAQARVAQLQVSYVISNLFASALVLLAGWLAGLLAGWRSAQPARL